MAKNNKKGAPLDALFLRRTHVSAWRHRALSPCASFLFEEGLASGCKRTPRRQGFRHRAHNNTNTLCLLFPTRAACLSINDLEFWRGKGTKSVPEGCTIVSVVLFSVISFSFVCCSVAFISHVMFEYNTEYL